LLSHPLSLPLTHTFILSPSIHPSVRMERADTFYCMLFNDEVHTYEQGIYTLQKALSCTQKEAVSFATTVDRDVSHCAHYLGLSVTYTHTHTHTHTHSSHLLRHGGLCALQSTESPRALSGSCSHIYTPTHTHTHTQLPPAQCWGFVRYPEGCVCDLG